MNVVFLGPPGAGKGTQAKLLAERQGWIHLSTGDLLRQEVRAGTPWGRQAEGYMKAGRLVPDEVVLEILRARLPSGRPAPNVVLDGYPRNLLQARELERLWNPEVVVYFDLPEDLLVDRLTARSSCPRCGRVYNRLTHPPQVSGLCDADRTPLEQRPDDRPEAVRTRLEVYHRETQPLLDHYQKKGILRRLPASGSVEEVFRQLSDLLSGMADPPRSRGGPARPSLGEGIL
jgi:adenylate kinase